MDNFNLRKYLAENKLVKELEVSDVNVKNDAENIMKEFIQAVEKASNSEEIFEKFENWVNSFMPGAIKEDLRKYLAENKLLKENIQDEDLLASQAIDILDEFRVYTKSEDLIQYLNKSMDYLERIPSNDDVYSAIQAVADGLNPYTGEEFDYEVDDMQSELERLIN